MSPILLTIAVFVFFFFLYKFITTKGSDNFPPGPLRLPFVGGYLQMLLEDYNYPHVALHKMRKKYDSPLLGFYLGDQRIVVANTYETGKEIMTRPEFQGRVDGVVPRSRALGKKLGIFFNDGEDWLHQKRFSLRELRDFGFGKRSENFEQVMDEEITDMLNEIRGKAEKGESILLPDTFNPVMLNLIYHFIMGFRLSGNDRQKLKELGRTIMRFQKSSDATGRLLEILPSLKHVIPETLGYKDCSETSVYLWELVKEKVQEHLKTFDKEFKRDYMDTYIEKLKEGHDAFSEDNLIMCAIDLIFPATTSSSAVSFALMFLAQNPEVLRKCQEELDAVVGRGRNVNLNDRQYLPYTEATFREVLRKQPIAPLGVFHRAVEDTTLFGYHIPADTMMVTNLYSMHNDEKLWGDPENFRPERFLDHRGNLKKKDYSLPFSIGKRVCAGETFARQNVFTTMANILQNFNVIEDTPIDFNKLTPGMITRPHDDFHIKLVMRD